MAKAEKGEDKDKSFVSGLFGSWHLHTGPGSASHSTMRDSAKRQTDGRTDV
jgi:hypothetical protein